MSEIEQQRPSDPVAVSGAQSSGRGSRVRSVIGFLVSLIALGAVVRWALSQEAPHLPNSAAGVALFVAALALYGVATLARGWRWHAILRASHIHHRAADAYAVTAIGFMGNTVLPARGGDVLRVVLMAEHSDGRKREIVGTLVAEKILDIVALVLMLAVVTVGGIGGRPIGLAPAFVAVGLVLAALAAAVVYLWLRLRGRLVSLAIRIRPITRPSRVLLSRFGIGLLLLSVVVWGVEAAILSVAAAAVDLSVNPAEGALLVTLWSLFALIPAAPGFVGTFEAALSFGLDAIGIRGGAAVGLIILLRFIIFVPVTLVGLGLLAFRYGGIRRLRRPRATKPSGPSRGRRPAPQAYDRSR